MFDLGASELLLIVIIAVIVIGPKDLPLALRTAGRWMSKARRMSSHFRSGIDAMIREAELEEMEKQWKARNEAIMQGQAGAAPDPQDMQAPAGAGTAESAIADPPAGKPEPHLPLPPP